MNRIYRLVWNRAKEAWVATAEIVHSKGGIPARTVGAVTGAALLALGAGEARALPTGGSVAAGQAAISQLTSTQMQITQSSTRAVINWNSFSMPA